jgi:hypothetical protein
LFSGVFVLAADPADPNPLGDDGDASVLLGIASGSNGEDEEDAFVSIALVGVGEGANEGGVGGEGMANERLGVLFVPIMAEASVADKRWAASLTLVESLLPRLGVFMSPTGGMSLPE